MKNITKQYQDLLEGKMSKANFMVNVRRDFPQWISPVNSFQDAVNILKSKRILVEADLASHGTPSPIGGENQAGARHIADMWDKLSDEAREDIVQVAANIHDWAEVEKLAGMDFDAMMNAMPPGQGSLDKLYKAIKQAAEDESMLSQMQSKRAGEFDPNNPGKYSTLEGMTEVSDNTVEQDIKNMLAKGYSYDEAIEQIAVELSMDPAELAAEYPQDVVDIEGHEYLQGPEDDIERGDFDDWRQGLNEAAQKPEGRYREATGKVEYDKFAEMDRVHYAQLMKGMEFELLKMPEISDENLVKAKKKAYNNLVKNPKYYMHLLVNNEKDVEKRDKDLRMQPVKGDNKVDKANGMKVIKKDEGSNTQESLGNKEKAKGKPEGVKEMPEKGVIGTEKVLRESLIKQLREEIMDEMLELGTSKKNFAKGQKVKTPDGGIGTVMEESPDSTCEVEMEDGSKKHYQANVLKAHEGKQVQEYEYGDESDDVSDEAAAEKAVEILLPNLEGDTYTKQELEDAFSTMEDSVGQHFDDDVFQSAINILKQQGYTMTFKEDKHAALKEKLIKAVKEGLWQDPKNPKKKYVTGTSAEDQILKTNVPGVKPVSGGQGIAAAGS